MAKNSLGDWKSLTTSRLRHSTEQWRTCLSSTLTLVFSGSGKSLSHLDTIDELFDLTAANTVSGT